MDNIKNNVSTVEVFMKGAKKGLTIALEQNCSSHGISLCFDSFSSDNRANEYNSQSIESCYGNIRAPRWSCISYHRCLFAKAAGAAAGLMLYQNGTITQEQATILYPAVILMGTLIGHYARIVLVSGVSKKYYKIIIIHSFNWRSCSNVYNKNNTGDI